MQPHNLRWIASILSGPVIFLFLLLFNPFDLDRLGATTLAIGGWMIIWWILEASPMPVVALMPLILFPLFHISTIKETANSYGDSILFLFLGGFMIGLAIEKWHLHKRIALNIVRITGTSGDRIVLGFIFSTGFISMWLSNTATTMMMFPIALSVIKLVSENHSHKAGVTNFATCIMIAIALSS